MSLTKDQVGNRVAAMLVEKFGARASVHPVTAWLMEDIGADSIGLVELLMEAEKKFDIVIPDEVGERWETVEDAIDGIHGILCRGKRKLIGGDVSLIEVSPPCQVMAPGPKGGLNHGVFEDCGCDDCERMRGHAVSPTLKGTLVMTVTNKATRAEVYAAIDGERDYQDAQRGNAKRHEGQPPMTPGEILLAMEECLSAARAAWYKPDGGTGCLPHIRKVVGLGVQAMERFGAPVRS